MPRRRLSVSLFRFLLLLATTSTLAHAEDAQPIQPTLLADIDHRPAMSLNGPWHIIVDPYKGGWGAEGKPPGAHGYGADRQPSPDGPLQEYSFVASPTIHVPGDWNTQRPDLFYYEGLLWYERIFDYHPRTHAHTILHVGASNYETHAFVNGVRVCDHVGGFTPFDCEITSAIREGQNSVVIAVDNQRAKEDVPTLKTDWWNYGGLTRDVSVLDVPEQYIDDAWLHLNNDGTIDGEVHVAGEEAGRDVTVRIAELKIDVSAKTDDKGRAHFHLEPAHLERWSPEHPRLYRVEYAAGADRLQDDVGFRTIAVEGDRILLNGKPIFLRGVNIQGEAPFRDGRAYSDADAQTLLGWAKELHCNFVRLAHYPHDERMTRLADRLGILVWSEIPVYWSIDWSNPDTLAVARQQLDAMIHRDHNKASVILWSMSNETPPGPERTAFLRELIAQARKEDPTRLITSAIVTKFHDKTAVLDDPIAPDLDVLGYNEYIGWYMGKPEDAPAYTWEDPLHKPVILSEFGAEAKAGLHGPATRRFTEEYQAAVYQGQFAMFDKMPFLAGLSAWLLMDFRSPTRQLPDIQDGFNRKGLVSDKGVKKQSFSVLQDYYARKQ
ncbi:glycoside hydrolase family 2 protein [Silvibacterium sp.]|uniref:glycoside hydrolase family 2 protein n=1 Tax=Silvibacterium sp. TaxID=1964179 RepID=UPI0039E5D0D5